MDVLIYGNAEIVGKVVLEDLEAELNEIIKSTHATDSNFANIFHNNPVKLVLSEIHTGSETVATIELRRFLKKWYQRKETGIVTFDALYDAMDKQIHKHLGEYCLPNVAFRLKLI